MARKDDDRRPQGIAELFQSTRDMMEATPAAGIQAREFWERQERILAESETFARAWFGRRNEATQAAVHACEKLAGSGSGNPQSVIEVLSEWQRGSLDRMATDAREYGELLARCSGLLFAGSDSAGGAGAAAGGKAGKGRDTG